MNALKTYAGCMSQYHTAYESLTFDQEVLQTKDLYENLMKYLYRQDLTMKSLQLI